MSLVPTLRQIRSKEEQEAILKVAREDNDGVMFPSHVVLKNGEVAGAVSLGAIPFVCLWHSSKLLGPKDSLILKSIYDAVMEQKGTPQYFIACNKASPYLGHMDQLGYSPIWETNLFYNQR